jgi:5-(carboxyamino)imidazole ribonucleotide synthase
MVERRQNPRAARLVPYPRTVHGAPITVAVLGGGQLGRMLGLAGIPLGLHFRFLDPSPDAPAAAVGEVVAAPLDDTARLVEVARGAAVVTFEWEGVPAASAELLVAAGHDVRPGVRSLQVAQDRLLEKDAFRALGIETAAYAPVDCAADLAPAVEQIGGLPLVLKTRRGGYDGKGQFVVHDADDLTRAWDALGGVPCIAEQLVPFSRELSVLAVRGMDGAVACWPLVENEHRGGILRVSSAPAPGVDAARQSLAEQIATNVLTHLDHVGVAAIELFEVDGELVANELAPRVHNSGHWTIEGAVTSQFENHLRAVLGLPLGSTAPHGASVMLNCIGALPDRATVLAAGDVHFHDYGKAPRPGRKVGHITVTGDDAAAVGARAETLLALITD